MIDSKEWWQSRTLWLNLAVFAVAVIGLVLDMSQALALPPRWEVYLTLAAAILNAGLRLLTGQPIGGSPAARRRPWS